MCTRTRPLGATDVRTPCRNCTLRETLCGRVRACGYVRVKCGGGARCPISATTDNVRSLARRLTRAAPALAPCRSLVSRRNRYGTRRCVRVRCTRSRSRVVCACVCVRANAWGRARDPSTCADRNIRGFSTARAPRDAHTYARTHARRRRHRTHVRGPAKGVCARVTPLACAAAKTHRRSAEPPPHQDRNQSPSPRRRSVSTHTAGSAAPPPAITNDDANSHRPAT